MAFRTISDWCPASTVARAPVLALPNRQQLQVTASTKPVTGRGLDSLLTARQVIRSRHGQVSVPAVAHYIPIPGRKYVGCVALRHSSHTWCTW